MKKEIPAEQTSVQNQIAGMRRELIRYYNHDSIGTKIVMSLPKDFIESYEAAIIIKIVDILRGSKRWEVKE